MGISRKDVEYLAHLARIELKADELDRFSAQLDEILEYVGKLKQARTDGVPPTSHVLPLANVFREDRAGECLPTDDALSNAPEREGPFFRVPQIIEPT